MTNKKVKHIIIENQISELSRLAEEIEKLAERWELPQALAMNINLVLEEAVSNIIFYAFTDAEIHKIRVTISSGNNRLIIKITDDGIPFNPLAHQAPDITSTAEERTVGGLGIFLISQIMDELHYLRKENQNILTLTKSL
jgi:serine/threonine-protein kinase RsbW